MILLAVAVSALFVSVVVAGVWASTDLLVRRRLKATVVVELKSGETFRGVLAACDRRTLCLRNVESLVDPRAAATVVDGELLIPRPDVKFMQRP